MQLYNFNIHTGELACSYAHLQSAWCIWRRSSQSLCWLKHCQTPHLSDYSEQSTVTLHRNSWQTARRSASSLTHSASSLSSCSCSIDLDAAIPHRPAAPILTCSTGCNWPVLLSWRLQVNQRLPARMSMVTGSMVFPSVWPVHGAILVGHKGESNIIRIHLLLVEAFNSIGKNVGWAMSLTQWSILSIQEDYRSDTWW